jgi:hypothetical protein
MTEINDMASLVEKIPFHDFKLRGKCESYYGVYSLFILQNDTGVRCTFAQNCTLRQIINGLRKPSESKYSASIHTSKGF